VFFSEHSVYSFRNVSLQIHQLQLMDEKFMDLPTSTNGHIHLQSARLVNSNLFTRLID